MPRAKSIRPKKPSPSQQLEAMVRSLGRPPDGLLAAALEGVTPELIMAESQAGDAMQLLADGAHILLDAQKGWKTISLEQRIKLGGFSTNLLALTATQFLQLEKLEAAYLAFVKAQEEAQAEVRRVFQRNLLVVEQAKRLLAKVARHNIEVREEVESTETPETTFELAQSLERLVILGGKLIRSSEVSQLSRAALYGLDDRYLDALSAAGAQLMEAEELVPSSAASNAKRLDLDRQRGVVVWLLRQIVEAFDGAHRVEERIPLVYAKLPPPVSSRTMALRPGPKLALPTAIAHTQAYTQPKGTQAIVRGKPAPTQILPLKIERLPK